MNYNISLIYNEVAYNILTEKDDMNRQHFEKGWLSNNIGYRGNEIGNRWQNFFGDISEHLKRDIDKGYYIYFFKNGVAIKPIQEYIDLKQQKNNLIK